MAAKFGMFVDADHSKLPTIYWLLKLYKRHYKSRIIGAPRGFGDLGRMAIYFQEAEEHW